VNSPELLETEQEDLPERCMRGAWARLIAKVYEVDPMVCPQCNSPMKVISVIIDPEEVRNILKHLVKTGRSPPGFDAACLD